MSKMKDEWYDEFFGEGYLYVAGDISGSKSIDGLRSEDREREEAKQRHPSSHGSKSTHEEVEVDEDIDDFILRWTMYDIQDELADLLISKHNDYGPKNITDAPGGALNGLRVRIHDKVARLNNLIDSGKAPNHESIRDTLIDLANYATIGIMVVDEVWDIE